jgi:hypothetical protein
MLRPFSAQSFHKENFLVNQKEFAGEAQCRELDEGSFTLSGLHPSSSHSVGSAAVKISTFFLAEQ